MYTNSKYRSTESTIVYSGAPSLSLPSLSWCTIPQPPLPLPVHHSSASTPTPGAPSLSLLSLSWCTIPQPPLPLLVHHSSASPPTPGAPFLSLPSHSWCTIVHKDINVLDEQDGMGYMRICMLAKCGPCETLTCSAGCDGLTDRFMYRPSSRFKCTGVGLAYACPVIRSTLDWDAAWWCSLYGPNIPIE